VTKEERSFSGTKEEEKTGLKREKVSKKTKKRGDWKEDKVLSAGEGLSRKKPRRGGGSTKGQESSEGRKRERQGEASFNSQMIRPQPSFQVKKFHRYREKEKGRVREMT